MHDIHNIQHHWFKASNSMRRTLTAFSLMSMIFFSSGFESASAAELNQESQTIETTHKNSSDPGYKDRRFALSIYYPYLMVLMFENPIIQAFGGPPYVVYLSVEAEYNFNRYLSFASEIRYLYTPEYRPKGFGDSDRIVSSSHSYAVGPGLRFYPEGEGMDGMYCASYYQVLLGTSQHGLYNPLSYRYLTAWLGYRYNFSWGYIDCAAGSLYSNRMNGWNPRVFPLVTMGVGISF